MGTFWVIFLSVLSLISLYFILAVSYITYFKAKDFFKNLKKSRNKNSSIEKEGGEGEDEEENQKQQRKCYHIAGTETASYLYARPSSTSTDSRRSVIIEESDIRRSLHV